MREQAMAGFELDEMVIAGLISEADWAIQAIILIYWEK